MASSGIKPYQIAVPDEAIEKLKAKLDLASFPEETEVSANSNYGVPLADVKRLVNAWKVFDWRKAEAKLNEYPHFMTEISVDGHEDALGIHFIHQKSENPNSIPLLFCHGWPGSFIEVLKILPLLTAAKKDGDDMTFHVVAPSIPNYGFSQGTSKPGFALPQYAEVCHKLMLKLGYEKYVTQGGDLGTLITRAMALRYPNNILASHLNFILALPPSPLRTPLLVLQYLLNNYTQHEKDGLSRTMLYNTEGNGYALLQASRPHTLGFALRDSPVGLLAWIYEKLVRWTDNDNDDGFFFFGDDEVVLTWVSLYWFSTAGPDASLRVYYEMYHQGEGGKRDLDKGFGSLLGWNGKTKLGLSYFPKDVVVLPSSWGRTLGPVVFEKRHDKGGHFAACERPEELVEDVRETFKGVVLE